MLIGSIPSLLMNHMTIRGANTSWNCLPRGKRKMRNHYFYSPGNEEMGNKLISFPGEWGSRISQNPRGWGSSSSSLAPLPQTQYIILKPKNLVALNNMGCIKEAQQSSLLMNFEQMQWNKVFYRMYVMAVIEVMSLSGHLSNIDEIDLSWKRKLLGV